jgi:3-deoxy-manno-octulosonate cytidylyltransferase (CMP-KDO synthetase)
VNNILGVIPARYASTRFHGKPLVDIGGKSMIQRVYEQATKAKSLTKVVIATDDERIFNHVVSFGGEVVMTSTKHPSGTDRCFEAFQFITRTERKKHGKLYRKFDYVINIQGDEPFIQPEQIDILADCLAKRTELATLVKQIEDETTLFNPNTPKVVFDLNHEAIYFTRQTVPYLRGIEKEQWLDTHDFFKHIGIYAYRVDILKKITKLPMALLESVESLEQLRWLANGFKIKIAETPYDSFGIDVPEDLEEALKRVIISPSNKQTE